MDGTRRTATTTDDFESVQLAENESMWIKVWEVNSKDRYFACLKCMCPAPDNGGKQYKMRKCPACGRTMRNGVVRTYERTS